MMLLNMGLARHTREDCTLSSFACSSSHRPGCIVLKHCRHITLPLSSNTGQVTVNFHPELRVLIAEAHYLDRKGFSIPPLALQVALQQGEYRAWTENLERLLQLYYSVSLPAISQLYVFFAVACCVPARFTTAIKIPCLHSQERGCGNNHSRHCWASTTATVLQTACLPLTTSSILRLHACRW